MFFAPIIFLFSAQSNLAQGFPYQEYLPRTLAELSIMGETSTKGLPADKGQLLINGKPFYSAVRVKYIGTVKPLSKEETDYLKLWQSSLGYDEALLKLFENKYLFKKCEKEYWVPMQKQVAEYLPKEVKTGDSVTLYIMFPGGLKPQPTDNWNFIFLANEFQKDYEE